MNNFGHLISFVFLMSSPLWASVHIIENSASRLTFRWELGGFDTTSQQDSGTLATLLTFAGENIALGAAGEPVLPGYSLYAGIPSAGSVRVSFTPGATQTIVLHHPLKIHRRVKGEAALPATQRDIRFSNLWISDPRYTAFRDLRAAHLVIRPVRYDAGSRTLRLLQSGECTIEFPAAAPTSVLPSAAASDYQRMLKRLLLNYDVAYHWTKPARRIAR
jgi:hypothetical protein